MTGLGKTVLQPNGMVADLNPSVRVRRKDTTVEITTLVEEHERQLITDFPNYLEEFIKLPHSYEFEDSRLHHILRFPDHMTPTTPPEFEWRKVATSFCAEQNAFVKMCRTFSGSKGSLMLSGFKPEKLFTIARQTMEYDYEQWNKQNPTKLGR